MPTSAGAWPTDPVRCALLPLLDAFAWVVGRLPQRLVLAAGRTLAFVTWPLLRSRRRIARTNVDLCFPALDVRARQRLANASVVNTVVGVLELVRAWHAPASLIATLGHVEGLPVLRDALARGGVLLLGAHFTHVEMAVRLITEALGQPVRELARRHNDPCLELWIERSRAAVFGSTVGKKNVRGLLRLLHEGHPVIYLGDQNFTYQNVFVPFFGVPAATLAAIPDLARRGRASVVPFRIRREGDGRYVVTLEAAWPGWPTGDATADAARYMAAVEDAARECPDQYLWVHQRFKTRPPGEPPVY